MDYQRVASDEKCPQPPRPQATLPMSDIKVKRHNKWREDPDRLLQTHYNQFCNVIMMATFTGGIQIAILAFMNDLTSSDQSSVSGILKEAWSGKWRHNYTVESFGMMIGFMAVALSMGCAGAAAVNAALTCYHFVHPPSEPPAMEGHVLLCMLLLFGSFALSGVSSTLLSTNFDLPFTIAIGVMLSGAVALAGYQILLQILAKRISPFTKPWHLVSVMIAGIILSLDILKGPTSATWFTMLACGCTDTAYVVAILFVKGPKDDPLYMSPWVQALAATSLGLMWVGYAGVKLAWGLWDGTTQAMPCVLAGIAILQVVVLWAIAAWNWYDIVRRWRIRRHNPARKTSDLPPSMIMPVPMEGFPIQRSSSPSSGLGSARTFVGRED